MISSFLIFNYKKYITAKKRIIKEQTNRLTLTSASRGVEVCSAFRVRLKNRSAVFWSLLTFSIKSMVLPSESTAL